MQSLGAAFQIQDDIIALISKDYIKERGIAGEDIHEGKRTLIVIDSMAKNQSNTKSKRLESILNMKTTDPQLLNEAIEILRESGSIDSSISKAK